MAKTNLRTQAILLQRTDYGEADRIITVITPQGQKNVIAKGVRREKSKLAGGIELLSLNEIVLYEGRGELLLLTSARMVEFFGKIMENYQRLNYAYWVLKDIRKLSRDIDEPHFFELTRQALTALNDPIMDLRIVDIWYRLQVAILSGVGVNLSTDINGMKLLEDTPYRFSIADMAFTYDTNGRYNSNHIKLLRVASAQTPGVVARIDGVDDLLAACLEVAKAAHE